MRVLIYELRSELVRKEVPSCVGPRDNEQDSTDHRSRNQADDLRSAGESSRNLFRNEIKQHCNRDHHHPESHADSSARGKQEAKRVSRRADECCD